MVKRKHDVLDDMKAADILTNLISVPRVGDDDGSAAATAPGAETERGAEAPEFSVTPNQGSTQVPVLGSAVPSSASRPPAPPPALASTFAPVVPRSGIPQNGTYPHPQPGMFPRGEQAALPVENGSIMPPPEFMRQEANAHAAAVGAAASMARSSVMSSQGIGGLEPAKDTRLPRRESDSNRFKQYHEDRWDYMLSELLEFKGTTGHMFIPHTYPPNPQLARWVKRQRRQYKLMNEGKTSTMTPERAKVLEKHGFVWDSHDAAWKEKISDLKKYRTEHGHCLVPSNYKGNPHLATWVKCQRRQYKLFLEGKSSAMNAKRIAELESEGFCWEIRGGGTSGIKVRQAPSVPTRSSTIPSEPPSLPQASGEPSTVPAPASTCEKAGNKNGTAVDKRDPPVAAV
mmetsp:Transcript_6615/g.13969  ORF Transcript_6615/g.13969 Transcript_6615/m.13969 type:complete len:400 (-) Transcript_6615:173-1372(-)